MQSNIMTREINFMGDTLMAAQDESKQIWVGVRWVCEGIGLTEDQMKRERKTIQTDLVLSKGGVKFDPPYKRR